MAPRTLEDVRTHWCTLLDASVAREKQRLLDVRIERPPHRKFEYEDLPEYKLLSAPGRGRIERLERALAHLFTYGGVRLGHLQVKLLDAVKRALVKRLFESAVIEHADWLKQRYGFTEFYESVGIIFPRRSGKTTVQTIVASAVLVSQPDGNQICFNITGRQAREWLSQARVYLELFQNSTEFTFSVTNENAREFVEIRAHAVNTVNKLSSYPGGQGKDFKNLRGMGTRLICCWIDEGYWFAKEGVPVVIPLLANGAALIITSSVGAGGSRTGLMAILDAKFPDGKSAIDVINYTNPCEKCSAAGKADQCTHIKQKPQFFQTNANVGRVEALLSPFVGVFERELRNKQDKPNRSDVWGAAKIAHFADPKYNYHSVGSHNYVYVGIDPTGGGESQGAIVSAIQLLHKGRECLAVQFPFYFLLVSHSTWGFCCSSGSVRTQWSQRPCDAALRGHSRRLVGRGRMFAGSGSVHA
jgi:hypothetical protein